MFTLTVRYGHSSQCNEAIDESVVAKVITNVELKKKYEKNIVESFIEDNKNMKWCTSTPSCGNCIQTNLPPALPLDVKCYCSHEFCFKCQNVPHLPATCDMMRGWIQKSQDDSETANYIVANTKECPKCGKNTEKNGGCNHMTCPCGYVRNVIQVIYFLQLSLVLVMQRSFCRLSTFLRSL